uniref:Uncharacterized protein n=1 Tax=Arundo donax TaxID=35708 RepID=A0A0A8ZDT2_ARUDO
MHVVQQLRIFLAIIVNLLLHPTEYRSSFLLRTTLFVGWRDYVNFEVDSLIVICIPCDFLYSYKFNASTLASHLISLNQMFI